MAVALRTMMPSTSETISRSLSRGDLVVDYSGDGAGSFNDFDTGGIDSIQKKDFEIWHYKLTGKVSDAIQCRFDIVERVGEGKSKIALTMPTKCGSRQASHSSLIQQPIRDLLARAAVCRNIRKQIKRAMRPQAANSGNVVQSVDEYVASLSEFLHHLLNRLRGFLGECLDRSELAECRCAGHAAVHEQIYGGQQIRRDHAVSDSPSGHRVCF